MGNRVPLATRPADSCFQGQNTAFMPEPIKFECGAGANLSIEALFPENRSLVRGISKKTNLNSSDIEISSLMSKHLSFSENETLRLQLAADWVFKLLFVMAAKPEIVSGGGKRGQNNKKGTEWFNPITVGNKYQHKSTGSSTNGDNASPRMHWRRGHFRHQQYGSRENPKYKVIWIEPMLVNASE